MRWGLGPVFFYECLTSSRRWQTYALRFFGASALLFAMWTIAYSDNGVRETNSWRDYARLGVNYFYALIGVELALVMLASPAATAGAICLDRARGTLAHMLMTDLSDAEIVLGKLAARMVPVMGLVACSWPVMAMCALLGGIDPIALTLAFAIIVAVAILGCTLALTLSVWARKSHEVILATYTVFILSLLIWPIWEVLSRVYGPPPDWTLLFNPFYLAFAPYSAPGKLGLWHYVGFFSVTLGASALLTGLAVWRTRPVACRGTAEKSRGPRLGLMARIGRWLPGPSLDRNPVLWREWHRAKPSRWMLVLLALLMGTTGVLCFTGAVVFWKNGVNFGPSSTWEMVGIFSYLLHVIFGLLMLSAIAPTSMAEERQRGSLDILAATALSTRAIVLGKWLGTFRFAALMAAAPGLLALAMATAREDPSTAMRFGPGMPPEYNQVIAIGRRIYCILVVIATILAHGALITSVGLALAVWMKRQSRAIAFSVGFAILVGAVWPIFVAITMSGNADFRSEGLASLSPVVGLTMLANVLMMRRNIFFQSMLEWTGFWAVEVFALAIGLLALTVRTFDDCFDRIPEKPRRIPVRAVVVMVLAGLIGAGSLLGAILAWTAGVLPRALEGPSDFGVLAYTLMLTVSLLLAATVPATLISAHDKRVEAATEEFPILPPRRFVLGYWWESFRLVILLAIGPALLALAFGTAYKQLPPVLKTTTLPSGVQVQTWEPRDPAEAKIEKIGEIRLVPRLLSVAAYIVTILVHGAAAVGIGLALSIGIKRSRRALSAGIGLLAVIVLVMPFYVAMLWNQMPSHGIVLWNFVLAADTLLKALVSRIDLTIGETLGLVLIWDVVIALFTAGVLWLAIRMWQRRTLGQLKYKPALEAHGEQGPYDVEPALIGE